MNTKVMTVKKEGDDILRAEVGKFLKKYRESKHMSQGDVGSKLGYKNINFISMMEKGASALPPTRILDIVNAYGIPQDTSGGIFSVIYEDLWISMLNCLCAGASPEDSAIIEEAAVSSYHKFVSLAAHFDIDAQSFQSQ